MDESATGTQPTKAGTRVIIRGNERLGPGYLVGPISNDTQGPWVIHLDTDRETLALLNECVEVYEL